MKRDTDIKGEKEQLNRVSKRDQKAVTLSLPSHSMMFWLQLANQRMGMAKRKFILSETIPPFEVNGLFNRTCKRVSFISGCTL